MKADAGGDLSASVILGGMFLDGIGGKKDPKKAKELLMKADAGGSLHASKALGMMFLEGVGGEKDEKKASKFLAKAGASSNTHVSIPLCEMLLKDSVGNEFDGEDNQEEIVLEDAIPANGNCSHAQQAFAEDQGKELWCNGPMSSGPSLELSCHTGSAEQTHMLDVEANAATRGACLPNASLQRLGTLLPQPVYLHQYSRNPKSFQDALLQGPELHDCREALQKAGLSPQLPCGAKLFVKPFEVKSVLEALQLSGDMKKLNASYVIVGADFENALAAAIASLRSSEQVHKKRKSEISAAQAATTAAYFGCSVPTTIGEHTGIPIVIRRTFIELPVASSLPSSSSRHSAATTTEASSLPWNRLHIG